MFQSLVSRPASARRRIAAVRRAMEYLRGQLVFLQQVTKPQDGALIRQPHRPVVQPGKFAVQRHVVQRLLHRRVGQTEPLLQEMGAQHRLHRKRWPPSRCVGRDNATRSAHGVTRSISSRNSRARVLDRQVQSKVCFSNGLLARWLGFRLQPHHARFYAGIP